MAIVIAALLLSPAASSWAQQVPVPQTQLDQRADQRGLRDAPAEGVRISERQAVNLARQRFTGNVLRISLVGEGNTLQYQIRMENEGRVFTVYVHASTGRVSGGS